MTPIAAWLSLNILAFGLGCALGLALSVALLRLLEEQQGLARALQSDAAQRQIDEETVNTSQGVVVAALDNN